MNPRAGATRLLAEWLSSVTYDRLPAESVRAAEASLLDFIGCAIYGRHHRVAMRVAEVIARLTGNSAQATVLGSAFRSSASYAALVNAVFGGASYLEDTAPQSWGHPSISIVPAALAASEIAGAQKCELLTSIVCGYEVAMRIGNAVGFEAYFRGWHPRGTFNVFGAAAAAAKALGVTSPKTYASCLGFAGLQASGLTEAASPHDAWFLLSGSAAHDGVLAALLAEAGLTGGNSVLEGKQGFLHLFGGSERSDRLTTRLGEQFLIGTCIRKRHASSATTHSAIDLLLEMKAEHHLELTDISAIRVRTMNIDYLLDRKFPSSQLDQSLPYLLAVAFLEGEVLAEQFDSNHFRDRRIRQLFDRIDVEADLELTAKMPHDLPARIEITLASGRTIEGERHFARGDPRDPLSDYDLIRKYTRLVQGGPASVRSEEAMLWVREAPMTSRVPHLMELLAAREP